MKKFLLIIAILFSGITSSYASHLMGAEITYVHVGGNDYQVTLVVYRDCSGINLSTTSFNVTFESATCAQDFSQALPFLMTNDVSQVCPGQTTTCNGGNVPGTQQFTYQGIVTLTPCVDWIMHWNSGTRNPATTNLVNPAGANLYVQNTLNNVVGAFNNSPQFFNVPTPYLCNGQLAIYSHAASDVDGDSLFYQFNNPLTTPGPPGTAIAFSPGYSLLQPMITSAGMNLDSFTGEMCFTPSAIQTSVVSVLITEFRNGLLIGSQIREMQVIVDATCTNQNPSVGAMATCGGTGGMIITVAGPSVDSLDQNSIRMCPNDSVCLQISFSDPDPLDNISVTNNIATAIPGATWTVTGNNTPNPVGTFCWVPSALDSGTNVFSLILQDDACPISGTQTFTYDITVFDEPYAGLDQIICGPQSAQLQASGGATYTWFDVVTNIQIPVGPEFSCNPCSNPIAMPLVTTDYYVLSSLTAACENTDTVRVNVVPDFVPDAIGDTTLCDFLSHQLGVNILSGPMGTYTYLWDNNATLSNDSISNPVVTPTGPTTYVVEVTSPDGCAKTVDSVFVNLIPPATTQLVPGNSTVCFGDPVNFIVQIVGGQNSDFSYQWSPSIDLSNSAIFNPVLTPSTVGITTYTVTITDTSSGCAFDRSQDITVLTDTLNSVTLLPDTFCEGGSSINIVDGGAGFASYQWIPSGGNGQFGSFNMPGDYRVIVSDGVCVDTSNAVTIVEIPLPHPAILGNLSICENETTTLYANNMYDSYLWTPNNETTDSITVSSSTSFVTLVVDSSGCEATAVATIVSTPTPFTTIMGIDSICPGVSLVLSTSSGPFDSYLWSPSNNTTPSTTATSGLVSVTVTLNGCDYTADSIIYTHPNPVANFTISPEASGQPNIDILFTDASTNAASWLWDFDVTNIGSNVSTETGQGPFNLVYDNQGTYTVSLTTTSEHNCVHSITKEYLIFSDIITPDIITPNNDGMNDFLTFKGLDPSLFPNHITILNRWGKKVYDQDNYNNNWSGLNLSDGTYFYVLTVDFKSGEEVYKGSLNILR